MAKTVSRSLGPEMSRGEQIGGLIYLPFYVIFVALWLGILNGLLGLNLTDLQINVCYFTINTVVICIVFRKFLVRSLRAIRFWPLVQAVILGFVLYYASNFVLNLILTVLKLEVTNMNNETVNSLAEQNGPVMIFCGVVLAPLVEETLVRGVIFGSIHRKNRYAAYIVSTLFFAGIHVWQYLLVQSPRDVLLAALQYLPAGIALGWTYEKAGTIWGNIALHMIVNAIAFGLMSFL